ncbi:MAG: nucleotidyltransferase family protein [Ideonella sp.]|nr:nucleotidyltransferase family protein [Ideonella sp.]MBL0150847.1 nucleotidyltransferase family protein [Ideonella sp.]
MTGRPKPLNWLLALREPSVACDWSLAQWEHVVRLARRLRLLARLAEAVDAAGLMQGMPALPRRHLIAEQRMSHWRTTAMRWAIERVAETLGGLGGPLVLLKGGAYIAQDLPIAEGRLPSDLDILVPRAQLADALARLTAMGWQETALDAHDQRYYADWSHEVAPMTHALHAIELDLHHNILPPVARTHVDAAALLAYAKPSKWPAWQVLDPVDQVLHSAAHLFLDSELRDRLRDLVDLDGLMCHFGTEPEFWLRLPDRAKALGLAEPLTLASHFCRRWLGTPIPEDALASITAYGPSMARRAWLVPLFERVLMPSDPDVASAWSQGIASTIVLARYHRQRLPMRLLVPHLWHKWRAGRAVTVDGAQGQPAP